MLTGALRANSGSFPPLAHGGNLYCRETGRRKHISNATHTFNDALGSRGRKHRNFLAVPNQGIAPFSGKSISPVLQVLEETYAKNGKWSHTTWLCSISEGVHPLTIAQDWGTGQWFTAQCWAAAITHIRALLPRDFPLTDDQIIRFVRAEFPVNSSRFDDAEAQASADGIQALFEAQAALAAAQAEETKTQAQIRAEIATRTLAEEARQEAAASRQRTDAAKKVLSKGKAVSLAELKTAAGIE